jgi:hypothetical protein
MSPTEVCTGPLATDFSDDLPWAHGMFVCDADCPMEHDALRRTCACPTATPLHPGELAVLADGILHDRDECREFEA